MSKFTIKHNTRGIGNFYTFQTKNKGKMTHKQCVEKAGSGALRVFEAEDTFKCKNNDDIINNKKINE